MAEQDLNIRLKLYDQLSAGLSKVQHNLNNASNTLGRMSTSIKQVSTSMLLLGGMISGAFALSLRNAAKYSVDVTAANDRLNDSFQALQSEVATAILPVFNKLVDAATNLTRWFQSLPKEVRDTALQWTFLAGIALVFLGTAGRLFAALLKISKVLIGFSAAHPVIMWIVAGVTLLIVYWEKLHGIMTWVFNKLEIIYEFFIAILHTINAGLLAVLTYVVNRIKDLIDLIARIPMARKYVAGLQEGFAKLSDTLSKMRKEEWSKIGDNMQVIIDKYKSGRSTVMEFADSMIISAKKFMDSLKQISGGTSAAIDDKSFFGGIRMGVYQATKALNDFHAMGVKVAQDMAQQMQSAFSNYFFDAFTGKLNTLENLFRNFGKAVLRIIADVLAQMAVARMMLGINSFIKNPLVTAGTMTAGGIVTSAGAPSIAGTGVTASRAPGMGGGGVTVTQPIIIQAWDTSDIMRNKEAIQGVVVDSLQSNGMVRKAMRRYT